jgi:hypothetical protein
VKVTNMSGQSRVNKTRRLLHINNLLKGTIEEDIMCIKLMNLPMVNLPMVRYSNGKDKPNSSRFNNRTEGFRFINTFLSSESAFTKDVL